MLVLTRKVEEGIAIGAEIRVVVLGIKGGQVRLGIDAPPSVRVHRDEVYARIRDENKQAALTDVRRLEALAQLGQRTLARRRTGSRKTP